MSSVDASDSGSPDRLLSKVEARFGFVPNFFRSAGAAPGFAEALWSLTESAYLDNPLPSLFKERLCVQLARFCTARYCLVRHVGFLLGHERPAGDPRATPETVNEALELLSGPALPPAPEVEAILARLEAGPPLKTVPAPRSPAERDLFVAASIAFLSPADSSRARRALGAALGARRLELLTVLLAFARTAHYWAEIHRDFDIEDDMETLMRGNEELAARLLSASDGERPGPVEELAELRRGRRGQALALQKSEEQFRMLVQSVTDYAIFMLDANGVVANWNSGARRIKGYEPHEIVGKHFSTFYSEEDRKAGIPALGLATAAREGRFEKEGWRYRKDGSRFWANVVIDRILDDDGKLVGFAKVTRDMTERREAQLALERAREAMVQSQKMEALGQLTGGVAHDFNNLLMAVLGSLELLGKRMPNDPKLKMLLNNAFEGARRGVSLTQRMLSFARRRELALSPVNAKELVAGMRDLLDRSLGPLISVETDIPGDLPAMKADPNQLETAILNLALNSRDAMPHGGVIEIAARLEKCGELMGSSALDEDCIVLSVIDAGEGMDETAMRRAMEPFFTTKGVGKGTGLGLSMVHGMAEQLGGRVRLKSKLGQGTTVELWLPIAEGLEPKIAAAPALKPAEAKIRKLTILVVDDDPLVLTNTSAMLEDDGHAVIECASGVQALETIRKSPQVDLVITDQAMPQMTGVQLAAAIRVEWPQMPILLVSGYAELPSDGSLAIPKLAKPYSLRDLRDAVEALMASEAGRADALASTYRD